MVPVLVLSHGSLAAELLQAARLIVPSLGDDAEALAIPWDVDPDDAQEMVDGALDEMLGDAGLLVLTDMFGGTATNLALPHLEPGRVEVVTGVNLPMLVKLGTLRDREQTLAALATRLSEAGRRSIHVASEFLRSRSDGPEPDDD